MFEESCTNPVLVRRAVNFVADIMARRNSKGSKPYREAEKRWSSFKQFTFEEFQK